MRFLVVDDDDYKAEKMIESLEGHGVDRASSYISAVRSLLENEYDGVVLDMGLPTRDGEFHTLEADKGLNVLREMQRKQKTFPTLIYSSNVFDVSHYEFVKGYIIANFAVSIENEVNDFLTKISEVEN